MSNQLIIGDGQKGKLSKLQASFNKLVAKIETLKKKKETLTEDINKAVITVKEKMMPELNGSMQITANAIKGLDNAHDTFKLTQKERNTIGRFIVDSIRTILKTLQAISDTNTKDLEYLYQKYNKNVSFEEEEAKQKEMMKDMLNNMFDIDIDIDMMENEDYMQQKSAEFKESFGFKERKKTKKQLEAAEKQKIAEDKMKKDTRSIYTQLAKLLHPDTEQDETKRDQKTEIMKRVTNAYAANDLYELLKIQIEVEQLQKDALANSSDEVMETYIAVLKKQVKEIEEQIYEIKSNPIFDEYFDNNDKFVKSRITKQVKSVRESNNAFKMIEVRTQNQISCKQLLKEIAVEFAEQDDASNWFY